MVESYKIEPLNRFTNEKTVLSRSNRFRGLNQTDLGIGSRSEPVQLACSIQVLN